MHVKQIGQPFFPSKAWFEQRAGRVTASQMDDVCHTSCETPAAGLLKKICYPDVPNFCDAATEWGKNHEEAAKAWYIRNVRPAHDQFFCDGFQVRCKPIAAAYRCFS